MCIFPDFDPEQIELLIKLSKEILARHPNISPTQVVGHSDIAPSRKNDPGPRFPWYQLYKEGIGAWYDNETVDDFWQQFGQGSPTVGLVQRALRTYGYSVLETSRLDQQTSDALSAFQMHFLPWEVSGKPTDKTIATLFALIQKYFPQKIDPLMIRYRREQRLAQQVKEMPETALGQVDRIFPERDPSKRTKVNDRERFKAYEGKGEIIIDGRDAQYAEISVNGQMLNIEQPFVEGKRYRYSLARRTRDGINHLKVANIQPEGAEIHIQIPFPEIEPNASHHYDFNALDQLINAEIDDGFPGAVLMVVKDGQVIKHSAYGYKRVFDDQGNRLPTPPEMETATLFDVASNTKMFATNFALQKLVTEGHIDIGDRVSKYIPEYTGDGRDAVTIKDLLTHTAGYAPQIRFFDPDNKYGKRLYSQSKSHTEQLILNSVPLEVSRDLSPVYSDTGFMLLGILIERVTGQALDEYVETQIYTPLGLRNSKFTPLEKGHVASEIAATEVNGNSRGGRIDFPNMRTGVIQGEVHDEKAFHSMQGVAGHAGLFSNAHDLSVLAQVVLNRGGYGEVQLFSASVFDQFSKASDADITLGAGWRRAGNGDRKWHFGPYASAQAIGHTGWTGTVTVIDPEYDLTIILLTNKRHTPVVDLDEDNYGFKGDEFELGRYGSIISLVYEAIL